MLMILRRTERLLLGDGRSRLCATENSTHKAGWNGESGSVAVFWIVKRASESFSNGIWVLLWEGMREGRMYDMGKPMCRMNCVYDIDAAWSGIDTSNYFMVEGLF